MTDLAADLLAFFGLVILFLLTATVSYLILERKS